MIDVHDHGAVRLLRMNHPPANALGPAFLDSFLAALREAESNGDIGALVLAGRPGMFSAGLDVPRLLQLERDALATVWRCFYTILRTLAASRLPVVAAIGGHSPAGGAVLSLFCDYRVMAGGRFRIGFNEVRVGLPLPQVILEALQYTVGHHRAAHLGSGGLLLPAAEAHQVGLVDEVVDVENEDAGSESIAGAVEARALAWAQDRTQLPQIAQGRTRLLARRHLVQLIDEGVERDTETVLEDWFSEETQQHLRALAESLTQKR